MVKWKALTPTLLALLIASVGSLFIYKWLQSRTAPKQTIKVASEAVPVVVTATDLPVGTKLKREMLKTSPYFKESLPAGYRSDPAAIEGRVTVLAMKQNDPVVEARLAPESITTGGVSAALPPGKRAVAVKGDKVIGISGFVQPGNRVDVFVTLTDPRTKTEVSKLVLDNIPVLATGTEIQNNAEGKPAPVDVYTLEVEPEQGEKLALAAAHGKLQFGLRNLIDTEPVLTEGADIPRTLASLSKPSRPTVKSRNTAVRTREVEPSKYTVEEIKGNKVTQKALND